MSDRPRILLVDDEAAIRQLYGLYFDSQGYDVITAANALDALTAVHSERLDVILLDIGLADTNGIDLVEPIKAINPNVPILIFTGRVVDQRMREAVAAKGVFNVLTKSHPLDYIVSELGRAVRAGKAAAAGI